MPLHFIRSVETIQTDYEFWEVPQIWVFGDREGLSALKCELTQCAKTLGATQIAALAAETPGMHALILPVEEVSNQGPAVRFIERMVNNGGKRDMQLIIYGNPAGLCKLSDEVGWARDSDVGPVEHVHVSVDQNDWVIPRSLSLNVRAAVHDWREESLRPYFNDIESGGQHRLPTSRGWAELSDLPNPSDIPEAYGLYRGYRFDRCLEKKR